MIRHRFGIVGFVAALLFITACGKDNQVAGPQDDAAPPSLGKPAAKAIVNGKTIVVATVTENNVPVAGVTVAFSRSVAGVAPDYAWTGTTDADGIAEIEISPGAHGSAGYYLVRVTDPASGTLRGTWGSVPVQGGNKVTLALPIGGPARANARYQLAVEEVHKAFGEALNAHDLDLMVSYDAVDAVYDYVPLPQPLIGREQIKGFFATLFSGFPDAYTTPGIVLLSSNTLVAEHIFAGTHNGEWLGIPPTGIVLETPHIDIFEFRGDMIQKTATYADIAGSLIKLGALPAPAIPSLVPSIALSAPAPTELSPVDLQHKLQERWNAHDVDAWVKHASSGADIFYGTLGVPIDRDALAAVQELYFLAFPDARGEIVRLKDMGDGWVVGEFIYTGTNNGPFFGIPATGNSVNIRIASIAHLENGFTTYLHVYYDNLTMLTQLGLVPQAQ